MGAAFRLFDDSGRVLVLRPDLTIPVARLVASRMADHPGPVRVSYVARAFRPPPPGRAAGGRAAPGRGRAGRPGGPGGRRRGRRAAGRGPAAGRRRRAAGRPGRRRPDRAPCSTGWASPAPERERLRAAAGARNLVAWRRAARALGLPGRAGALLARPPGPPRRRPRCSSGSPPPAPPPRPRASGWPRRCRCWRRPARGDAVLVDLGVMRDWSYYSGIVFEAYAPGVGAPLAVGGRYDGVGARFGRPRPAVGFAITLDLLHRALGRRRPRRRRRRAAGVVLVGGLDAELGRAPARRRAAGLTVVALPDGRRRGPRPWPRPTAGAGWRAVPGRRLRVLDRASGERAERASPGARGWR